jgi:hypothetical protein
VLLAVVQLALLGFYESAPRPWVSVWFTRALILVAVVVPCLAVVTVSLYSSCPRPVNFDVTTDNENTPISQATAKVTVESFTALDQLSRIAILIIGTLYSVGLLIWGSGVGVGPG